MDYIVIMIKKTIVLNSKLTKKGKFYGMLQISALLIWFQELHQL